MKALGKLALFVLCASLTVPLAAWAQSKGPRRAQVFLVPYNTESASMATQVSGLVEKSLKKDKNLAVVDLTRVLGSPPPASVDAARKTAIEHLTKGKQLYASVEFDEAATQLKKAVAIFQEQAAWVHGIPEYSEALAYLGATYVLRGDAEDGRKIFKELVLYDRDFRVDPAKLDPSLQNIVDQVREQIISGSVGSMSVYSKPEGARVFIDNKEMGFTPASLDKIPTGRHVLRIEHMGTFPYGQVIDVIPTEDKVVRANLEPTEEFKKLGVVVKEIGKEIGAGKVGPAMIKLGQYVGLDWAVYGLVTHSYGEVTLNAWLVSIPAQRRLASRRTNFPDSEFNLDKNVDAFIKDLIKDASSRQETVTTSNDPLDSRSGTDEWWSGSGKKKQRTLDVSDADVTKNRRGSDDPLDSTDGTEDW